MPWLHGSGGLGGLLLQRFGKVQAKVLGSRLGCHQRDSVSEVPYNYDPLG